MLLRALKATALVIPTLCLRRTQMSVGTQEVGMPTHQLAELASLVRSASSADDLDDVRGILWLEHLNMIVGDRAIATRFYCDFLGFTPDPNVQTDTSFHVNLGRQQLHLAVGTPHRLHGAMGLAVPSLRRVLDREASVATALSGTRFSVEQPVTGDHEGALLVTCPWGNRFHVYDAEPPEERLPLTVGALPKLARIQAAQSVGMGVSGHPGIRYVCIDVPRGSSASVGAFYREMFGCRVTHHPAISMRRACALVTVGASCHLVFMERESEELPSPEERHAMKGVHLAMYVADFKQSHDRMKARGLVWTNPRFVTLDSCESFEEAVQGRQYRFKDIVEPERGDLIIELEHETRALRHFQFFKPVAYEPR